MNVVFLDIDGVLNSANWMKQNLVNIRAATSMFERSAAELNPDAVRMVSDFVIETGAIVVISSSWRFLHSREDISEMLKQAGWSAIAPVDTTPRTDKGFRGDEVRMWIDDHTEVVHRHVILDDDSDFHEDQPLVRTSWETGITVNHIAKARSLLTDRGF